MRNVILETLVTHSQGLPAASRFQSYGFQVITAPPFEQTFHDIKHQWLNYLLSSRVQSPLKPASYEVGPEHILHAHLQPSSLYAVLQCT